MIALLLTALYSQAAAQWKSFDIGPYGEVAIPTGLVSGDFKHGLGGGVTADIRIVERWAATLSVGYMELKGQHLGAYKVPDLGTIPLRAGVKYRASPFFYLKMDAGWAAYTGKSSGINDYDGGAPLFSPGIGFRIKGLDLQAKYEIWIDDDVANRFIGLKMGWNF